MYYKNVWYSEPEIIAYCDRLNEQNKMLKEKLKRNETEKPKTEEQIIYNYLLDVKEEYNITRAKLLSEINIFKVMHKRSHDDYKKYQLERCIENRRETLSYYKNVLEFVSGTIELLEKRLKNYEKDNDKNSD